MIFRKIKRANEEIYLYILIIFKRAIIVRYYRNILNVGDDLNQDIIEYYSGKKAVNPKFSERFRHILMVGSVIDKMNENSTVLGSGLICTSRLNKRVTKGNILAVRGPLTLNAINELSEHEIDVPMGDFALLMPRIYRGNECKLHPFGLVLHYVDESHPIRDLVTKMGGIIIDVKQKAQPFIEELTSCEIIISSSMHGLILSDAYNIPNKRLILSDKLIGGDFKFKDYYATTDHPNENFIEVDEDITIEQLSKILGKATVKNYVYDLDILEKSLKRALNKFINN